RQRSLAPPGGRSLSSQDPGVCPPSHYPWPGATGTVLGVDLRVLQLPGQVARLLDGPAIARVLATGGEDDAPASQLQEEEDVQALQEHRVHREVVAGQDRLAVGTLGSVARGFLLVAVRVGCGGRGGGYGCWWWRLDGRA